MTRVAIIGCGAIGCAVIELIQADPAVRLEWVVVPGEAVERTQARLREIAPRAVACDQLDLSAQRPDLIVECAGHDAVERHVLPALRQGVAAIIASIGSLHDAQAMARMADAARQGNTRVQLVAGAIGGIDALAAARLGGLTRVEYTGRKPPHSWRNTPAEALCDLGALREPFTLFEGTAREAARLYPKNANVAATVSIAGLGLDATRAVLVADPGVTRNVHRIVAEGAFGRLDLTMENEPLAANPKTSALTVYSVLRAIHNASNAIAI